jgi:cysteine-rich repeat protein
VNVHPRIQLVLFPLVVLGCDAFAEAPPHGSSFESDPGTAVVPPISPPPAQPSVPVATAALPERCGDGIVTPLEVCDDGNAQSGDGCFLCRPEPGFQCTPTGECQRIAPLCGDGLVDAVEQCDPGNAKMREGCGADCKPVPGYECKDNICVRLSLPAGSNTELSDAGQHPDAAADDAGTAADAGPVSATSAMTDSGTSTATVAPTLTQDPSSSVRLPDAGQ